MSNRQEILFADEFDEASLDVRKWLPFYLPHWSSGTQAKSRYAIQDSYVRLLIESDQEPWCPEFDGDVRVSNLQTGHWSGPVGSPQGQHRFRNGLKVRRMLPQQQLFVPHYCRLEMRARATLNPWNLAALWLIGFEDLPDLSGEITVFEVFGHDVAEDGVKVGQGIKKIRDPRLTDEFNAPKLPITLEDWHVYGMDWNAEGIAFSVGGNVLGRTRQSPDYPMQLMLNLYDLPSQHDRSDPVKASFDIDYVRAWGT